LTSRAKIVGFVLSSLIFFVLLRMNYLQTYCKLF